MVPTLGPAEMFMRQEKTSGWYTMSCTESEEMYGNFFT